MSGNVWEWCNNWYENYYETSKINPKGASSGMTRVFRGGSWNNDARSCRVSMRRGGMSGYRNLRLGFRLAYSIDK